MPITDEVLRKNVRTTLYDVIAYVKQAQTLKGRARTGYYKVAIYSAASVVEALLYHRIERAAQADSSILYAVKTERLVRVEDLRSLNNLHESDKVFRIYECQELPFKLDKTTMLSAMNDFCLDAGLIDHDLHKSIQDVRDLRNKVHLQGLVTTRRQFNGPMLDKVLSVILDLYRRLDAL